MTFRLRSGEHNYNFVDLTGREIANCQVIRRLPNNHRGHAMWLVRAPCGHLLSREGIKLREREQSESPLHCATCRSRKVHR